MSDTETQEEYLERIKNVPGVFSDYNETADDVATRPARLLAEAVARADQTDLAPDPHEGSGAQEDAVGYVYPGTEAPAPKKAQKKEPVEEFPDVEEGEEEEPEEVEEFPEANETEEKSDPAEATTAQVKKSSKKDV